MSRPTLALAALASSLLVAPPVAGQNPWNRVPAPPTSCFVKDDSFVQDASTIRNELVVASDRQTRINTGIRTPFNEMDVQARQNRLMAFMSQNPTKAGQYMQDAATTGARHQQIIADHDARRRALDARWRAAESQYDADRAVLAPLMQTYMRESSPGGSAAAARTARDQYNTLYGRLCAKWFTSSTSPFVQYLSELKHFLTQEVVPYEDDLERLAKQEFDMYGVGHTSYRSTGALDTAVEYLAALIRVYGKRDGEPLS